MVGVLYESKGSRGSIPLPLAIVCLGLGWRVGVVPYPFLKRKENEFRY